MALPTKDLTLKDKTYRMTQLSSGPGRKLWLLLIKKLGPGAISFLRAEGDAESKVAGLIGAALDEFLNGLQESEFEHVVEVFAGATSLVVDGAVAFPLSSVKDTTMFAGDYMSLSKWLLGCLEFNYGSFLEELGITFRPPLPDGQTTPLPSASRSPSK